MNKEKYLAAVASWKQYINDGKHKKYKVHYDAWVVTSRNPYNAHTEKDYGYRWESALTVHHHVFYALLRRKSLAKGFGSEEATEGWINTLKNVANYLAPSETRKHSIFWANQFAEKLLAPFGGHITKEDFIELMNNI